MARQTIAWARKSGLQDGFKRGQRGLAFEPVLEKDGHSFFPVSLHEDGVVLPMRRMKHRTPFDDASKRDELHQRIKDIPGLVIGKVGMEGFPKAPLSSLTDEAVLRRFSEALNWLVEQIRSS